jgi:hypothetical protein
LYLFSRIAATVMILTGYVSYDDDAKKDDLILNVGETEIDYIFTGRILFKDCIRWTVVAPRDAPVRSYIDSGYGT